MAVSNGAYLKQNYSSIKAHGDKAINSDGSLEIIGMGHEVLWNLTKQFPWPVATVAGEIEIPGPLGITLYQPQQTKIAHQGQVAFQEVRTGEIDNFLIDLIYGGGKFDARVYEGTPTAYLRKKDIYECFIVVDNPDRDFENRSQPLLISGNMFFHYFGEIEQGNSTDYRPA
jgi:hypothetical protein